MPGSNGGTYARFGAFCKGLQDFDAAFFMLPASEALALDPNTRHLLHLSQVSFSCARCHHFLLEDIWQHALTLLSQTKPVYCVHESSITGWISLTPTLSHVRPP